MNSEPKLSGGPVLIGGSQPTAFPTSDARIELLGEGNVIVSDLIPQLSVPVGGSRFARGQLSIFVIVDSESSLIRDFLGQVHARYSAYNLDGVSEWLQGIHGGKSEIDPKLFVSCHAFTVLFEKEFVDRSGHNAERTALYAREGQKPLLSTLIVSKLSECAEIALMGQLALQKNGFQSVYFGGGVLGSPDYEFADEHSFVVITRDTDAYVWDAANPIETTQGPMPSIYKVPSSFLADMRAAKGNRFQQVSRLLAPAFNAFGVTDGSNVLPKDLL